MRDRYIEQLSLHLKNSIKDSEDYLLGIEVEHLLVRKSDLSAISYFQENGINDILHILSQKNWSICEQNDSNIICLIKGKDEINLEPGGQLELSFHPRRSIKEIQKAYIDMCGDIIPLIDDLGYLLLNIGYHPSTTIKELPILPKMRYKHMWRHFKSRGKYAHNMMKGTASIQISIDYSSLHDFQKKFKIANWISPIFYAIFDNSPVFEGKKADKWAVRADIWYNCDDDRCGIIDDVFNKENYTYNDYASYILDLPAIYDPENINIFLGEETYSEMFIRKNREILDKKDFEHILSFAFNDVRLKEYIEIRMADSLPYPLFLGYLALIKGLFYNEENLDTIYDLISNVKAGEIRECIYNLSKEGVNSVYLNMSIKDWYLRLSEMAESGLDKKEDKDYLLKLNEYIFKYCPVRQANTVKNDYDYCDVKNALEGEF